MAIYYVFAVIGAWHWFGHAGIPIGFVVGGAAHWSFSGYSHYSRYIIGALGVFTVIPYLIANGWIDTAHMLKWFVFAFGASYLADRLNPGEDTKEYDAFHAVWHIFSAIGIYYLIV